MLLWLYNKWDEKQRFITKERQLELKELTTRIDLMTKQINNIYEILEKLTNDGRIKDLFNKEEKESLNDNNNNVQS